MKKFIKQKLEEKLGFRTPDHLRSKRAGAGKPYAPPRYNPSQFKTQHKG
jgi:hypothetical protein